MANKEECDRFAAEIVQRFEAFTKWAIDNWPHRDYPLLESDFEQSRRELQQILGPKLSEARPAGEAGPRADDGTVQYVNMNPAPWP